VIELENVNDIKRKKEDIADRIKDEAKWVAFQKEAEALNRKTAQEEQQKIKMDKKRQKKRERKRLEQQRLEQQRLEQQRLEQQRLEQQRKEERKMADKAEKRHKKKERKRKQLEIELKEIGIQRYEANKAYRIAIQNKNKNQIKRTKKILENVLIKYDEIIKKFGLDEVKDIDEVKNEINEKAFGDIIKTIKINIINNVPDNHVLFKLYNKAIKNILLEYVNNENIKIKIGVGIMMKRNVGEKIEIESEFYFKSNNKTILHRQEDIINDIINECKDEIDDQINSFVGYGSNWWIERITKLYISIVRVRNIVGGSFIAYKRNNALVNIQNEDNKCFLYCVLAHLHPVKKNAFRVSNYTSSMGMAI
jgi:hypothetical protein